MKLTSLDPDLSPGRSIPIPEQTSYPGGAVEPATPPASTPGGLVLADTWEAIEQLLPEWRDLYRHSTAASQFSAPDLLLAWARVQLGPGDRAPQVVAYRSARGLEAVAVFSVRRIGRARVLQLIGCDHDARIVELPEIVTRRGGSCHKPVRQILQWAAAPERGVDWASISVAEHQGWPEGTWAHPTRSLLKTARCSVVLPLRPEDWFDELPKVKRNLRESLRRGRNRLNRDGRPWHVEVTEDLDPGWPEALADLRDLHRRRSQLPYPRYPRHPDELRRPDLANLLTGAAGASPSTRLEIRRLMVDGRPLAALLTLRNRLGLWISVSGLSEEGWHFSALTLLKAHAVRAAALAGLPSATFSIGVDDAKLRWSEDIRRHHEFLLVRPGRRTRVLFTAYWQLRALTVVRRVFRR